MILDRLCQLERLEKLVLRVENVNGGLGSLKLWLEDGLSKLETLRRLRVFEAPRGQFWGVGEARWALEHWVQLRELNVHVDSQAKQLLRHRLMAK